MRGLIRTAALKSIPIVPAATLCFRQRFHLFHIKLKGRHDTKLGHFVSMANNLFCIPAVFKANHDLYTSILKAGYECVQVGDNVKPGKIINAIHQGYHYIRVLEED